MTIFTIPDAEFPSFFLKEVAKQRQGAIRQNLCAFRFGNFSAAWVEHYLYPLSLLYVLPRDGWIGVTNKLFLPGRGNVTFGANNKVLIDPILLGALRLGMYIMLAIGYSSQSGMSGDGLQTAASRSIDYVWPILIMLEVMLAMRSCVIAIKYGYMSDEELRLQQTLPFDEWAEIRLAMQVASSYLAVSPAFLIAESERAATITLRASGIDACASVAKVAISATAAAEMRNRIAYDVRRLALDPNYVEPLSRLLHQDDEGKCSVAGLVVATRLAAQPKRGFAAKPLDHIRKLLAVLLAATLSMPFVAPVTQSAAAGGPRPVFLYPFDCGCSFVCERDCGCVALDGISACLLICMAIPLFYHGRALILFLSISVLEASRLHRSMQIWGRMMETGRSWPPARHMLGAHGDERDDRSILHARGGVSDGLAGGASYASSAAAASRSVTVEMTSPASRKASAGGSLSNRPTPSVSLLSSGGRAERALDTDDADDDDAVDVSALQEMVARHPETPLTQHTFELRPPLLPMVDTANVHGWEIGRQLLLKFGERFRIRIQLYCGFFLTFAVVVFGTEALLLFAFSNRLAEFHLQIVFLTILLSLLLCIPLGATLLLLARTNELNATHRRLLSMLAMGLRHKLAKHSADVVVAPDDDRAEPPPLHDDAGEEGGGCRWSETTFREREGAREALEAAKEQLAHEAETAPLTMLGIPANYGLISSIFSLGAIGFSVAGSFLVVLVQNHYDTFAQWRVAHSWNATDPHGRIVIDSPYANCSAILP